MSNFLPIHPTLNLFFFRIVFFFAVTSLLFVTMQAYGQGSGQTRHTESVSVAENTQFNVFSLPRPQISGQFAGTDVYRISLSNTKENTDAEDFVVLGGQKSNWLFNRNSPVYLAFKSPQDYENANGSSGINNTVYSVRIELLRYQSFVRQAGLLDLFVKHVPDVGVIQTWDVTVSLVDINDNFPLFTSPFVQSPSSPNTKRRIGQEEESTEPIFTLAASDADSMDEPWFFISTDNTANNANASDFVFENNRLAFREPQDYENPRGGVNRNSTEYQIVIGLTDGIHFSTMELTVYLIDVLHPTPLHNFSSIILPDNPVVGQELATFTAKPEQGGVLHYTLRAYEQNPQLAIRAATGVLYIDNLAHGSLTRDSYDLVVEVWETVNGDQSFRRGTKILITAETVKLHPHFPIPGGNLGGIDNTALRFSLSPLNPATPVTDVAVLNRQSIQSGVLNKSGDNPNVWEGNVPVCPPNQISSLATGCPTVDRYSTNRQNLDIQITLSNQSTLIRTITVFNGSIYTRASSGERVHPQDITYDAVNDQLLMTNYFDLFLTDNDLVNLSALKLPSLQRVYPAEVTSLDTPMVLTRLDGVAFDRQRNRALVLDRNDATGRLLAIDLTHRSYTLISELEPFALATPDAPADLGRYGDRLTYDEEYNRVFVLNDAGAVLDINLNTGREIVLNNLVGPNRSLITLDNLHDLAYDKKRESSVIGKNARRNFRIGSCGPC